MTTFTLWFEDGGELLVIVAGLIGALFGYGADRLAARWPAHEDGSIRRHDWRTVVVGVAGAVAFAATVARFGANPVHLVIVGAFVAALVVMLATDLDQRLLPNLLTLPIIPLALVVFATGSGPFVRTTEDIAWAAGVAIVVPVVLYLLAIPFGNGAIGEGDLKLLVGAGLLIGAQNLFYGLVVGALAAGVIVGILVFIRRLSMKSFVPYGPFLIAGILWSILALPQP
ncbi:MAG TPA: A24 family peptidase [Candidatus Limnocylindria bacterium]|nr:A24 family peptidase [Candidatus Limnocylindria bacterium]